jgi:hypothetical protein
MTVADDVAMSVQHGLIHCTATGMIHVVNAISGSECALVHELMQPAIHHVNQKGRHGGASVVVESAVRWWVWPVVCL